MPLFELDESGSRLVQPMQPAATSFGPESAALVTDHLSDLLGEGLLPVATRRAADDEQPHMLALDVVGQPIVVEVVAELDAAALIQALAYAGQAGRLTSGDLAHLYHEGPEQFGVDLMAFRDSLPAAYSRRGLRVGARLLLVCSSVHPEIADALDFLRAPGRQVEVLQMGVIHGAGGRRFLDVSPLAGPIAEMRQVEQANLRLVRSKEAFAAAMAYDEERKSFARFAAAPDAAPDTVKSPFAATGTEGSSQSREVSTVSPVSGAVPTAASSAAGPAARREGSLASPASPAARFSPASPPSTTAAPAAPFAGPSSAPAAPAAPFPGPPSAPAAPAGPAAPFAGPPSAPAAPIAPLPGPPSAPAAQVTPPQSAAPPFGALSPAGAPPAPASIPPNPAVSAPPGAPPPRTSAFAPPTPPAPTPAPPTPPAPAVPVPPSPAAAQPPSGSPPPAGSNGYTPVFVPAPGGPLIPPDARPLTEDPEEHVTPSRAASAPAPAPAPAPESRRANAARATSAAPVTARPEPPAARSPLGPPMALSTGAHPLGAHAVSGRANGPGAAGSPRPDPGLEQIGRSEGPFELVWMRERRGQRLTATLRTDGLIELPGGDVFDDPDAAAKVAAHAALRVDGWGVWRIGDDGPTLRQATSG